MTSSGQQPIGADDPYIADMRARYIDEGFSFVVDPDPDQLPPFLGGHRPYAIARKPGERSIAIEVLRRRTPAAERSIEEIRRLFEGHADWRLIVVVTGRDPLETPAIPAYSIATIHGRIAEVRTLVDNGQCRAAFLMAYALLEAAYRRIGTEAQALPGRTLGTVVQSLAMHGFIEPELERRLYPLVELRNRIVHGDLAAEPSAEEVEAVLVAVEQVLDETDQLDQSSSTGPSMASVAERNSRR